MSANYVYLIRPKRPGFGAGMTSEEECVMDAELHAFKIPLSKSEPD
jgi:hypothetical protein